MIILILVSGFIVADIACRVHDHLRTFWQARVVWEGVSVTHKARDEREAHEWAACYPAGSSVVVERVFHGKAREVARRATWIGRAA